MTQDSIERTTDQLRRGGLAVLVDDQDGSGEGELIGSAHEATSAALAFAVRHSSGFIRVALAPQQAVRLQLPPMVASYGGAVEQYTVTVDAAEQVTTGISAHDRATTVRLLGTAGTTAAMLHRPGHTVPVCGPAGGTLTRAGRVAAALDLAASDRLSRAAYLGAIVSESRPTEIARGAELIQFADRHGLPLTSVSEVEADLRRRFQESTVVGSQALLTPLDGPAPDLLQSGRGRAAHLAMRVGGQPSTGASWLGVVRECPWDRLFGAAYCDCESNRDALVDELRRRDGGVLIYLRTLPARRPQLVRPSTAPAAATPGWACAQSMAAGELTDEELVTIDALRLELGVDRFVPLADAGIPTAALGRPVRAVG